MTVCMYVSPPWNVDELEGPFVPVIIADTMVSFRGLEDQPPLLPIRGYPRQGADAVCSTTLKRKINYVDDCAIALSGNGQAIEEIVLKTKDHLGEWMKLERPLRPFANLLTEVNRTFGHVADAIAVVRGRNDMVFRGEPKDTSFREKHFGTCVAHGSGANDIIGYLHDVSALLDKWDLTNVNAWQKANTFMNQLNGRKLLREFLVGKENGWGGFIEWAYMQPGQPKWTSGPSVLHVLMFNEIPGISDGERRIHPRFLAYDPEIGDGSILTVDDRTTHIFTLQKILSSKRPAITLNDWKGWSPKFIVLTVALDPANPDFFVNQTLNPHERHWIKFNVAGSSIEYGIELPDSWVSSIRTAPMLQK